MASTELQKRVITGALGASALILLILFGTWIGIYVLTLVLVLGMVYEFGKICLQEPDREEKLYLMLFIAWFMVIADMINTAWRAGAFVIAFLGIAGYFLFTARRHGTDLFRLQIRDFAFMILGLAYLVLLPLFLPSIHELARGELWSLLFFLIVWSNDTAAYFIGKKYGKRKLYPIISPKKTIEGSLGGLAAGLVVSLIFGGIFIRESWAFLVIGPVIVGAAAQLGDLVESFMKRAFEVKDSGSILPGHGGFLDRFDGVVFALPVMYAFLRLLA